MTDFLSASLAGVSQIIIGHPFDTAKVFIQNKKLIRNLKFRDYYRGYQYPLVSSIIVNSILFPVYERTKQYTNSAFISGYLGGAIISPLIYISDYNKIKRQTKHKLTNNIWNSYGKFSVYNRESIAYFMFFGVYDYLKQRNIHPLIAGAVCGLANWTVTYPIDVIKCRQIAQQITIVEAIKQKNMWKGYSICALRAVCVNPVIFYTYETCKYFLEN